MDHVKLLDSTRLLINRKKQNAFVNFDDASGWEEVSEQAGATVEAAE